MYFENIFFDFSIYKQIPPIPIPSVSQSSLPGENIYFFVCDSFCDLLPTPLSPSPDQSKFLSMGNNYRKKQLLTDF